ncbi:MAG: GAF domain-containing sensor histidine kinase [Candidatus Omnitrophota bacterium]
MKAVSQKKVLKSLLDISGFTNYVDNPELILSLIVEECMLLTQAEWGAILTYDSSYNPDSFKVTKNLGNSAEAGLRAGIDTSVKTALNAKGKGSVLDESFWGGKDMTIAILSALGDDAHSIAACPIRKRDDLMGLVLVINKKGKVSFSKVDRENLSIVCQEAAIVLENISLFKSKLQNEKMAAVGQTMTGIAHYIKNVLQGVTSGSYVLDTGLNEGNMDVARKAWAVVDRNTKRISELIMDMLYYAKDRKPEMRPLETQAFLNDIFALVKPALEEKGVEFKTCVKDLPSTVTINEQGIHRSILNIIFNAADACMARANGSDRHIRFEAFGDRLSGTLRIAVTDNGIGMEEDVCEKIFQPFYSKSKKGTGLGLAITQKVMTEHGGSIKVVSEKGKGSTFELSIPLSPACS